MTRFLDDILLFACAITLVTGIRCGDRVRGKI
jgi:hypothetical protein